MSKVEFESFLKSFLLFFSSLGILISILFYINYKKEIQTLDEKIFSQMRLCSLDFKCKQFTIDFIKPAQETLYTLYKSKDSLRSYYPVPNSEQYIMSFEFGAEKYEQELIKLRNQALWGFSITLSVIFALSIIFSIYALYPLRNALLLTQEFIKDILHDFNTPLASLRLNSSMLKREIGENEKVSRIEQSVQNILKLQLHLRSYLQNHTMQKESFDLQSLVKEQLYMLGKNYPHIHFHIDIPPSNLHTNKEAFSRIIDNLITNAAKYNKQNGFVNIIYENNNLKIIDSGKGIKKPKYIFDRFYKEQDRGIGIGLHIVKKLCDELGIKISVVSILNEGTQFTLDLSKLTFD